MCAVEADAKGRMSGSVRYDTVFAHLEPSSLLVASEAMTPGPLRSFRVAARGAAGPGSWRSGVSHA
jgi:hypothetical protein